MPNPNLCEIAILLDRSGSMASICEDMEGGFKTFIEEQRKIPDPCVVSLYQFDSIYEEVFVEKPLSEVTTLGLVPRSATALLDAMGRMIVSMGVRLAAKPEEKRPGKVIVLVITDGQENASREFTRDKIKSMVETQTNVYNWQFAFLGANMDAFDEASSIGISGAAVMNYVADAQGVQNMYSGTSSAVQNYRSAQSNSAKLAFTPAKPADDSASNKTP